ncbi:MAG: hypothetical protein JXJ20_01555 [Anaerolineae bacterium]|nr:hypothetical protein [Anaerolineae bacterium]
MDGDVGYRLHKSIGFLDFPRDVTAQTREAAYEAYSMLAQAKVRIIGLNFDASAYLNGAGIGLVISLVEDAIRAGCTVYAYGLSAHYRKVFSMVGLNGHVTLVTSEQDMRNRCGIRQLTD